MLLQHYSFCIHISLMSTYYHLNLLLHVFVSISVDETNIISVLYYFGR